MLGSKKRILSLLSEVIEAARRQGISEKEITAAVDKGLGR